MPTNTTGDKVENFRLSKEQREMAKNYKQTLKARTAIQNAFVREAQKLEIMRSMIVTGKNFLPCLL